MYKTTKGCVFLCNLVLTARRYVAASTSKSGGPKVGLAVGYSFNSCCLKHKTVGPICSCLKSYEQAQCRHNVEQQTLNINRSSEKGYQRQNTYVPSFIWTFFVEKFVPRIIQINQQTRCNNFSSLLLDVYVQLNMFRAFSRPSSGTQQLQ
jgi:hypothetical protein